MQAPVEASELSKKKKRGWALSFLGLLVLCGIAAGGFFVIKAQQMSAQADPPTDGRFVSDSRY